MAEGTLFPERIETDRLELELATPDRVDPLELYRVCSGIADEGIEEVTRYVTWEPHEHPQETVEYLRGVRDRVRSGDGVSYVVRPRRGEDGAGEIAGGTGFDVDWERKTATLGMWLRRPFWGRGYSGERAGALLGVCFDRLDLEVVAVSHHVDNDQSRRAVEKYVEAYGGRREGVVRNGQVFGGHGPADVVRYSVTRERYLAAAEKD
jgi:RimJ/RimL family protein N-acetyltransferase